MGRLGAKVYHRVGDGARAHVLLLAGFRFMQTALACSMQKVLTRRVPSLIQCKQIASVHIAEVTEGKANEAPGQARPVNH